MTVELLSSISDIALMAAILFLVVAVILFFAFKIPEVINELTGARAKKTITVMEQQSAAGVSVSQKRRAPDYPKPSAPPPQQKQNISQQYDVKTSAAPPSENTVSPPEKSNSNTADDAQEDIPTEEIDETVLEKTVYSATHNGEMNVVSTSPEDMLVANASENSDFKVVYELGFFESTEIVE